MLTINLTDDIVEGEPGPNFYWLGLPTDFLNLVNDIHILGEVNGYEINLKNVKYVKILHNKDVILRSSANGNLLCGTSGSTIAIDLDRCVWREVLNLMFNISFFKSHNFVEFDDLVLVEEANFIISSEDE